MIFKLTYLVFFNPSNSNTTTPRHLHRFRTHLNTIIVSYLKRRSPHEFLEIIIACGRVNTEAPRKGVNMSGTAHSHGCMIYRGYAMRTLDHAMNIHVPYLF
ncbi:hypothetical protein QL285_045887 [Trifolium repens]|nr:hypothetical protein QL285_045887 [Trifolium repens]